MIYASDNWEVWTFSCCLLRIFQEQKRSLVRRRWVIDDIFRMPMVLQPRDNATSAVHAKEDGPNEGRGLAVRLLSQ